MKATLAESIKKQKQARARAERKLALLKASEKRSKARRVMRAGDLFDASGMLDLVEGGLEDEAFMERLELVGRAVHRALYGREPVVTSSRGRRPVQAVEPLSGEAAE